MPPQPLIISYSRYSSPEQAKGDSQRRQDDAAAKWCAERGWALDTRHRYRDDGISSYRGANSRIGALASILQAADRGEIPEGSYLLIEALDRLTRQQMNEALMLFLGIINRGIIVVSIADGREYRRDMDQIEYMWAIMVLGRGNNESLIKSDRVAKAWARKRLQARELKPMTSILPSWLYLDRATDKIQIDERRANMVRRIYRLALEGYGALSISGQLAGEGISIGKSYVFKILHSRAAIGEYQPRKRAEAGIKKMIDDGPPIPGYYPAIIDEAIWSAVQVSLRGRRGRTGKTGKAFINLFSNLLRNPLGKPICAINKGSATRLYCAQQADGSISFPVPALDTAIIGIIAGSGAEFKDDEAPSILPDLRRERIELDLRLEALGEAIGEARHKDAIRAISRQMEAIGERRDEIIRALQEAEAQASAADRRAELALISSLSPIEREQAWIAAMEAPKSRLRIRQALRALIRSAIAEFSAQGVIRQAKISLELANGARISAIIQCHVLQPQSIAVFEAGKQPWYYISWGDLDQNKLPAQASLNDPNGIWLRHQIIDRLEAGMKKPEIAIQCGIRLTTIHKLRGMRKIF